MDTRMHVQCYNTPKKAALADGKKVWMMMMKAAILMWTGACSEKEMAVQNLTFGMKALLSYLWIFSGIYSQMNFQF